GALRVPALGEERKLRAPRGDGLADQFLALEVTLGGIDHVEAGVEGVAEQADDGLGGRLLVADLRAAEAEDADAHVRLAKLSRIHRSRLLSVPPSPRPARLAWFGSGSYHASS